MGDMPWTRVYFYFAVCKFHCHYYEKMSSISSRCAFFPLVRLLCLGSSGAVARLFTTTARCEEGLRAKGGGAAESASSITAANEGESNQEMQ